MSIPALRTLARPFDDTVIPVNVTQPFGFNNIGLEPAIWDYHDGTLGFSWESGATECSKHAGVDYGLACGTPLLAPASGIVQSSGHDTTGFGLLTILDHGSGLYTLYGHQSRSTVLPGQQIAVRQQIGLSGGTVNDPYDSGNSTGCHLHWATCTPDGHGYWLFFSPEPFVAYQPPAPLATTTPPYPTAGRYKVLVATHMRVTPAVNAAQGVLVNVGDILTADAGWTTSWRRCKTKDGHEGWVFAPDLAAA